MNIYEETEGFFERFCGEKRVIGKSVLGRNIYAVKIGYGRPTGIVQYAIHGREWITTKLAFLHATSKVIGSVWLVPLSNPDGALLSQEGIASVKGERQKKRLLSLSKNGNFSLWKANARGVDLNVNFPARWGTGKSNAFIPSSENYVGEHPFSEPETLALKRFTEEISPDYTLSYHSKGEEIYWYFYQPLYRCAVDKAIALEIAKDTGYSLSMALGSVGGYKDWCIEKRKIPSFTIEVGADCLSHPLSVKDLGEIVEKNKEVLHTLSWAYRTYAKEEEL